MILDLGGLWHGLTTRRRSNSDERTALTLQEQVDAAHREWQAAQGYFQVVSDPELVDHAIYMMEAAQRKYLYLFRQLRETKTTQLHQEG